MKNLTVASRTRPRPCTLISPTRNGLIKSLIQLLLAPGLSALASLLSPADLLGRPSIGLLFGCWWCCASRVISNTIYSPSRLDLPFPSGFGFAEGRESLIFLRADCVDFGLSRWLKPGNRFCPRFSFIFNPLGRTYMVHGMSMYLGGYFAWLLQDIPGADVRTHSV
ncbi:hypothetical protein BDW62DRAFT_103144 [Aspergillus aurantiobrunneus]